MIAFVVSVNGKKVGTFGVGDSGVLSAHISWAGEAGKSDMLDLGIGGLDSNTDEHIRWPYPPSIKVGDTVSVQVIETDQVDSPTDRKTPAQLREEEKTFLAEMKANRKARLDKEGKSTEESAKPSESPSQDLFHDNVDDELPPFAAPWE